MSSTAIFVTVNRLPRRSPLYEKRQRQLLIISLIYIVITYLFNSACLDAFE